jgi:hypothetical protein
VLQILQAAPQLGHLQITLKCDSDGIFSTPMKVFCRELVLTVCYKWRSPRHDLPPNKGLEILHFFERVQFVGMKSMTLQSEAAQWTVALVQGFLQSMKPSMSDLTCLTLRDLAFNEEDLISNLSLLPSLQTFHIFEHIFHDHHYPSVKGSFFHALTAPQADFSENVSGTGTAFVATTVIVPQLKELVLKLRTPWFGIMDLLVNMVHARPRLSLLHVGWGPDRIFCAKELKRILDELELHLQSCRPDFRVQGVAVDSSHYLIYIT